MDSAGSTPQFAENPDSAQFHTTMMLPRYHGSNQVMRRNWALGRKLLLIGYDGLWLNIAFLVAYYVRFDILKGITFVSASPFVPAAITTLRLFQVALVVSMLLLVTARGLYRLRVTGTLARQFNIFFTAAAIGFAMYSIYEYLLRSTKFVLSPNTRAVVIFAWAAVVLVPFSARILLALGMMLVYRLGIGRSRILVIGSGRTGKIVMQHFAALANQGYHVVGFINEHADGPAEFGRFTALGTLDHLEKIIREEQIGEAIIALPTSNMGETARSIRICERNAVPFRLVPGMQEFSLTRIELEMVEGLPLLNLHRVSSASWQRTIKRVIDIVGSSLLLIIGTPIWCLLILLIKLDSPGPIIYRQARVGRNGNVFTTLKFRSMYTGAHQLRRQLADQNHAGRGLFKVRNDPRVTRVGRFIRRASIDEIPQLINVLRGEMSLVGPRPPLPEEYARYETWEKRRLEVTPGLTGLWQVRGRSEVTFEEMVLMDLYYIENWSLHLDLQILLKTLPVVLFGRGAY